MTPPPEKHTRYRKPTRRQKALMAMGVPVVLQPLPERPVIAVIPIELCLTPLLPPKIVIELPIIPSAKKVAASQERHRLLAERKQRETEERELRVAKMLGKEPGEWRRLIEEDENSLRNGTYIPPVKIVRARVESTPKIKISAPTVTRVITNNRPLFPDYNQFYGPKWKEVQAAAMARAKGRCEVCKRRKARHVHHILPYRYFEDAQDAHFLENTLAVCIPCHQEEHRKIKREMPLLNQLDCRWQ